MNAEGHDALQVAHGRIKTVQLAEHITTGRQQWLQWHADFADNLPALIQVIPNPCPIIYHRKPDFAEMSSDCM